MPVWRVASIQQEPQVVLSSWRIMETPEGTRHFVGYNENWREGRVSSAIQAFDPVTLVGRTRSGRIYQLRGASGYNSDAEYVWAQWCYINKVTESVDVSERALCETAAPSQNAAG